MIRTQVQFEERQYEALRQIAHRKRISLSEVVRQAVDTGLGRLPRDGADATGAKALLSLAGIGASGLGDLGRAHDHYLDTDAKK